MLMLKFRLTVARYVPKFVSFEVVLMLMLTLTRCVPHTLSQDMKVRKDGPVPDPRSPYLDFAPTPPSFDIVHGLDNEGGDDDVYNDVDVNDNGFPAKYYSPYSN